MSSTGGDGRPHRAGGTPEATASAWAEAWRGLDADAVADLFTDDATYVAALSGEVADLRRGFTTAARTWAECRIEDLRLSPADSGGDDSVLRARYRFCGITRRGNEVAYAADATFRLRLQGEAPGVWLISSFQESFQADTVPTIGGKPLGTLRP